MAGIWTLETGGLEQSLTDWGIAGDFTLSIENKGKAFMRIRTVEDFDAGVTQWQFFAHAIVRRDRLQDDVGNFSGGTIYFQGYFDDPARTISEGRQNVEYTLNSVWWLLELLQFKQQRNEFAGFDAAHQRVANFAVSVGGSNYKIGDILTVPDGIGTAAAQAQVVALGAGDRVTMVIPANSGGSYTTLPATRSEVTGGAGEGCELTLIFGQVVLFVQPPKVCSEVYLGEKFDAVNGFVTLQNNGDQIKEILNWVNECYNATKRGAVASRDDTKDVLQVGTIDPRTFLPITRQNTIYCAQAIHTCLLWNTDGTVVEDFTTSPPTVNVRLMAKWNNATNPPTFEDYTNLPEVTINLTVEQERDLIIKSQVSRQLAGVIIYYRSVNVADGVQYPQLVIDRYPPDVSDYLPAVSSHTIDMLGSEIQHVIANVQGKSFSILGNAVAWWIDHDPSLDIQHDPLIETESIFVIGGPVILDNNDQPINPSDYPYELIGTLPDWIGGTTIRAKVSQRIGFNRFADANRTTYDTQSSGRVHSKSLQLTDVPPGTYQTFSAVTAEVIPQNVAESVYRSAAATMYSGRMTFQDDQLRAAFGQAPGVTHPSNLLGFKIKAVGPNTTFLNLLAQKIEAQPHLGRTTIDFGAVAPLDVDQWIQLARASRLRTTYAMPSGRGGGGIY